MSSAASFQAVTGTDPPGPGFGVSFGLSDRPGRLAPGSWRSRERARFSGFLIVFRAWHKLALNGNIPRGLRFAPLIGCSWQSETAEWLMSQLRLSSPTSGGKVRRTLRPAFGCFISGSSRNRSSGSRFRCRFRSERPPGKAGAVSGFWGTGGRRSTAWEHTAVRAGTHSSVLPECRFGKLCLRENRR